MEIDKQYYKAVISRQHPSWQSLFESMIAEGHSQKYARMFTRLINMINVQQDVIDDIHPADITSLVDDYMVSLSLKRDRKIEAQIGYEIYCSFHHGLEFEEYQEFS